MNVFIKYILVYLLYTGYLVLNTQPTFKAH